MTTHITFYFDFVSPNSHIAAHGIGDIAAKHARAVDWCPESPSGVALGSRPRESPSGIIVEDARPAGR